MVDLVGQYKKIKREIDKAVIDTIESSEYINGSKVKEFQKSLEKYLDVKHVIPVANGTDALQISLMALDLKPGDEVIVPAFTYIATAEVIALLQLTPVMVDVDPNTFNLNVKFLEKAITKKTKAIVPVHLYGQTADMEDIIQIAKKNNIAVIEDNAQAIGADYYFSNKQVKKAGTIGNIGTTSFFPAKNLGAYGDGGAIFTNDDYLAKKMRMIANHGQSKRYYHDIVGVNSRLDSIQAAILQVKLKYLDEYIKARQKVADYYNEAFKKINSIETPFRADFSSHVFHQYTLKIKNGKRDKLHEYLKSKNIPNNTYYPVPLYKQKALKHLVGETTTLPNTESLCKEVISLPIHTEMTEEIQDVIIENVLSFFE